MRRVNSSCGLSCTTVLSPGHVHRRVAGDLASLYGAATDLLAYGDVGAPEGVQAEADGIISGSLRRLPGRPDILTYRTLFSGREALHRCLRTPAAAGSPAARVARRLLRLHRLNGAKSVELSFCETGLRRVCPAEQGVDIQREIESEFATSRPQFVDSDYCFCAHVLVRTMT